MNHRTVVNEQKSKARMANLTADFSLQEWEAILHEDFNFRCAVTGESLVDKLMVMGHAIPWSWGHGGTYKGNIIPLLKRVNDSMSNRNPLPYFDESLLKYLADQNGLTIPEYESFVTWCFLNQRSEKERKNYVGVYNSLDEWKKSLAATLD